ncbi:tRNA methyltransferase 44 [Actinomortierella ambigua]|nr:tRNA methyltransferase 44 [Actinomortierella ambigua]
MNRWIMEAPSIIPPVEGVEIVQDSLAEAQGAQQQSRSPDYALLQDRPSCRRCVHRRLLPKRKDKDPVMDEAIIFYDAVDGGADGTSEHVGDILSTKTAFAIFAPMHGAQSTPPSPSDKTATSDSFQTLVQSLPFFYPALRAFRYGYCHDPEEEDKDKDGEHEGADHGHTGTGDVEYQENSPSLQTRRAGWITLDLLLAGDEGNISSKLQYAFKELFKKLFKWGVNTTKGYTKSKVQHDVLVPKDLYLETYARLKEKHAKRWVEEWPERTDTSKFVFEDIAIAAWLVALWQLEREQEQQCSSSSGGDDERGSPIAEEGERGVTHKRPKLDQETTTPTVPRKQTFMDLGCGNGLLCHILNEEGHVGTGIDISSRKVWALYGSNTRLQAKALIPNEAIFEGVDWIIGNHADELAPWVPIIAARSKPWTKFVVIPCCFFDLNGKYTFPQGYAEGKYKAYVDHIEHMIDLCGYQVEREVLRIPSTKNIALVGRNPKIGSEEQTCSPTASTAASVLERIDAHVQTIGGSTFVPRLSDREKQQLSFSLHEASVARRHAPTTDAINADHLPSS